MLLEKIKSYEIFRPKCDYSKELRGQVRFTSHLPAPWEIKEFKTNIFAGVIERFTISGKAASPDHAGVRRTFHPLIARTMIHNKGWKG